MNIGEISKILNLRYSGVIRSRFSGFEKKEKTIEIG
tara:strand:- start:1481 stop:1588 length:108 start_codon:yes stop_codon:yes gene_type:complete